MHYGDKIPPEYVGRGAAVLSGQGITVDTIAPPKTREELAEAQRRAEIEQQRHAQEAEVAAHNRMLLETFSTEEDMIMARDNKISAIDSAITLAKKRIEGLKEKQEELRRRAAGMERDGRIVPEYLHDDIIQNRQQIEENQRFIEAQSSAQEQLRAQFEDDLKVFRKLKDEEENRQKEKGSTPSRS